MSYLLIKKDLSLANCSIKDFKVEAEQDENTKNDRLRRYALTFYTPLMVDGFDYSFSDLSYNAHSVTFHLKKVDTIKIKSSYPCYVISVNIFHRPS